MRPFSIMPASSIAPTLSLAREGNVAFTVTNVSGGTIKATATAKGVAPARDDWFTVDRAEREMDDRATEQFVVRIQVPEGTAPGRYSVTLQVADEGLMSQGPVTSGEVSFVVPEPVASDKPALSFPWLWIAIGAGVLLLLVGIGVVVALSGGDDDDDSASDSDVAVEEPAEPDPASPGKPDQDGGVVETTVSIRFAGRLPAGQITAECGRSDSGKGDRHVKLRCRVGDPIRVQCATGGATVFGTRIGGRLSIEADGKPRPKVKVDCNEKFCTATGTVVEDMTISCVTK